MHLHGETAIQTGKVAATYLTNNDVLLSVYFAKAFDSINHNKLLVKLHSYGIVGKTLDWNKEFLNNRSFCVKLNNTKSN